MTPPIPQFAQLKIGPDEAMLVATYVQVLVTDQRAARAIGFEGISPKAQQIIRDTNAAYIRAHGKQAFAHLAEQFKALGGTALEGSGL